MHFAAVAYICFREVAGCYLPAKVVVRCRTSVPSGNFYNMSIVFAGNPEQRENVIFAANCTAP